MSHTYHPTLERLRYWQGQTLHSVDARDQQRFDALRRRLHNRALHATDGVAFGLAVKLSADDPQAVEVACGLAYDQQGRELILQRGRRVVAPDTTGKHCLRLKTGAASQAGGLLEHDLELGWEACALIDPASDVILARIKDGALDPLFVPKQARPIVRARLANGVTIQGDTPWEPWVVERSDGAGGISRQVVGVQTHIDTSASGFTQTPRYVANLHTTTLPWDLERADFAPAFFAHVADPAPDGFTFRLLMAEVGRRRFSAWNGTGRVEAIERGVGERLVVTVDAQASFKVGDAVAQLRPRASVVVQIGSIDINQLTLDTELEQDATLLAAANLPRTGVVAQLVPASATVVADYTATLAAKKNDLLWRSADNTFGVIDRVTAGQLTVGAPFPDWKASDALALGRIAGAGEVRSTALSADGASLELELRRVAPALQVGMPIALLGNDRVPRASTTRIISVNGNTVAVQPIPPAADVANLERIVALADAIIIHSLQRSSLGRVKMDRVSPFRKGDYVAASHALAKIVAVTEVDVNGKHLELSEALDIQVGSVIVGAHWQWATTIETFDPAQPKIVTVARKDTARAGDCVALRVGAGLGAPVAVASVAGKALTLDAALTNAARLATLAVGRFPRVVTVVAQETDKVTLTVAEAGVLRAGDCVLCLPAPGAVLQVKHANGAQVVLSDSPGLLMPGRELATLHWRHQLGVISVDPAAPTQIVVDDAASLRAGDVLGPLVHYADCSSPGYVDEISGNKLTLRLGTAHGDGIVAHGWIDGGLLGPAAVCLPAPSTPFVFPDWQPELRMETLDGLEMRALATAYGLDLITGRYQSRAVYPIIRDQLSGHLMFFYQDQEPYRFRPETLSVITRFNADFSRDFATFAQKQQLVVRWIGCQNQYPGARGCPAQAPHDPCESAARATLTEDL